MKKYTGIGSRKTPPAILGAFSRIASRLEACGYTLRSGAAGGADSAFEDGTTNLREIFIPWKGFAPLREGYHVGAGPNALALAESLHPAWDRCSRGARALHGRNTYQVLGKKLDSPSEFLICWTPRGEKVGGTATAIRLAEANGVRVFNFGRREDMESFRELLEEIES